MRWRAIKISITRSRRDGGGGGEGFFSELGIPGGESTGPGVAATGGTHPMVVSPSGQGGIATAAVGASVANGPLFTTGPLTFATGTGGGGGSVGVIKVFAAQQIHTSDPTKVSPLPSP